MRISTFILSFCGFCVLYICNADWIDELIEDYLGSDYEEIAPFVSSVTAGTEEFDKIVEELSQSRRRWWPSPSLALLSVFSCVLLCILLPRHILHPFIFDVIKTAFKFLTNFRKTATDKEEIQSIVSEFLEKKFKQLCRGKQPDDVPVKLLWKGGTLVESTMHCNIKEQTKLQQTQRNVLNSRALFGPSSGQVGKMELVPSSSETSTARKMAEIRKLLESEQELPKFKDEGLGTADKEEVTKQKGLRSRHQKTHQPLNLDCDISEEGEDLGRKGKLQKLGRRNLENKTDQGRKKEEESKLDSESEFEPDPKLMNRIRLLESRLRLEELKNKNWINRMSRAEGILQQLNKQVERIEESRPMGTLTETLKITSTVTNWAPSSQPRRNMRFTLVNQYPLFCMQTPYTSLSELIKKEVGLPTPDNCNRNLLQLPPTPQIGPLSPPIVMPQPSILSKFLCR